MESSIEIGDLAFEQGSDMDAGLTAHPAQFDNLFNLGKREAQSLRLLDESKYLDHLFRVEPISVFATLRTRQESNHFVVADRLGIYSRLLGHLANEEPISVH